MCVLCRLPHTEPRPGITTAVYAVSIRCLFESICFKKRSSTRLVQSRLCVSLCAGSRCLCQKTQCVPLHTGFMHPLLVAPGLATCASLPSCPIATVPQHCHELGSFPSSVDAFVVLGFLTLLHFCQPCPHSPVIGWCSFPARTVMSKSAGIYFRSVPIL